MSKAKKPTSTVPDEVRVRYNLLELPTAQHKAGLAGLLLQVDAMKSPARKINPESIPHVELVGSRFVDALFTERSIGGLFDDLYDAKPALAESPSRWPGAAAVEEKEKPDPKTGKPRKIFVYQVVQPQGHFLRQFTDDGKEIWHKLWRDMLWTIPRGKPTTRGPFNNRAAGQSSGEGEAMWKELLAMEKARERNEQRTCEVAGAILLGAQAANAESVPFRDRVEHALLLHFWQLSARIFVPERIDSDGKREFVGYVLAIPEVADLRQFNHRYKRSLGVLDAKARGYRPASAVISLPAQAALEFMDSLARLAGEATSADLSDVARALAGVEFFHMVKAGNNVKAASGGRVAVRADLIRKYEGIRETCRNPMFLSARLIALLQQREWYSAFSTMLVESPWPLFVMSSDTPRTIAPFAWDARQRFEYLLQQRKARSMSDASPSPPASLETLVYRLVRRYVRSKTDQKSPIKYESFKDKRIKDAKGRERVDYPSDYTKAQEKVCSDLFLGMRSRRDEDFVSYFTATIASVAQGTSLSGEADFRVIAEALLDSERRRDVQTLAMLAVAAASYSSSAGSNEADQTDTKESAQ